MSLRENDVAPPAAGARLLTRSQVLDLLGVTHVTLYTWMRSGQFPLALTLGPPEGQRSKIAWDAAEVQEWIRSRPRRQLRPIPIKNERKPRRAAR